MAREYIVRGDNITVAANTTILVFINPAAAPSPALEFIRCWASQRANATSAQAGIEFGTKVTAFPTLTSSAPTKTKLTDPTSAITGGTAGAAGTSGINASANGGGTETPVYQDNFNVLNGWLWVATPSETVILVGGSASGFYLKFTGGGQALTSWSFGVLFREIG